MENKVNSLEECGLKIGEPTSVGMFTPQPMTQKMFDTMVSFMNHMWETRPAKTEDNGE